jgi:magnesium chelatase subunit I
MPDHRPTTLGELKASGYQPRSVKDEIRRNLLRRLEAGTPLFPGIIGYDDTVIPQLVAALLARQNFILLGLRGQAKSRLLRQLVPLLDEAIPVLAGSEVNDDPLRPISRHGRLLVEEHGDDAPIAWVEREARFVEKLATPDVTIADIIGDVDPIRAARGGHVLADELSIHFGLLPRANRGVFALNELPDLSGKVQVGLFNVMQEGDIQIKGYPVRLPLDMLLVFTANPEDYTARGKIITPLKDRIGAEVMTHYPDDVDAGIAITRQEAWIERDWRPTHVPAFILELVERVALLARRGKRPHVAKGAYDPERVQLCVQGLILEEHGYECTEGVLYFADSRERVRVEFDDDLRSKTLSAINGLRLIAAGGQDWGFAPLHPTRSREAAPKAEASE